MGNVFQKFLILRESWSGRPGSNRRCPAWKAGHLAV